METIIIKAIDFCKVFSKVCKKCSCNLIPLRSGESLSKDSLMLSSLTCNSYSNKAQNQ